MLPSHIRVPRGRLQRCTPNTVLCHTSRLTINATEQQACCPALAWECAGNSRLALDKNLTVAYQPYETERSRKAAPTAKHGVYTPRSDAVARDARL